MPSITYVKADIWVRAVNDAMGAGKPVIATDVVGAAFDMVKSGINGFIVPEKDSDALYKAIKKIISEPELAKRMGEKSKRILEQGFTYEHMIKGFMKAVVSVNKR
jgi:glycosyltransferase involved in cell wall biosynthesis